MADQTTVGTPLESAVELAAGRMSGPIKTVAAPLTCTSELAENVVYPGGLSAVRNPEDVVTQNALCIRATAPADLGDEDAFSCEATILSANQYLPHCNVLGGVCAVTATTMAECGPEIALLGSISGLVFKAISYMFDAVVGTASNLRFTYVVGGLKGSAAASYPAGSGGGILPIFFGDPEDQQDAADAHYFVTSALVTERPAGGSWAVADINNLTNVALAYDYAAGSTECTMVVAELWIEVYGASGSVPEPIIMRQKIGMPVRKETAGDVIEANQQLGTAVISKRMKFKATV